MALTGTETLYVLPTQSNGQPSAETIQTTTAAIAALASSTGIGETVVTNITTVGNGTLTAAAIVGGIIQRTGPTAAYSDATDTAAAIITAIGPAAFIGQSFIVTIKNATGFDQTLTQGIGVTLPTNVVVPAFSEANYLVRLTSLSAVTFSHVGASLISGTMNYVCSTQLDATSNTTLANVAGMLATVVPGTYRIRVFLAGTAGASGGWKLAFSLVGTVITSWGMTGTAITAAAIAVQRTTTATTQTSLISTTAANLTGYIEGTAVIGTGGTMQLQFAQNASNGTVCSIFTDSTMEFTRIA